MSVLLEGEEECGGANLFPFLKENAAELKADVALVCDTGMADRRTPGITTSLRGMMAEEVVIQCASHDLHSGLYGNAAANPIAVLCQALATLRNAEGGVTLPGFYDGIQDPSPATRAQWSRLFPMTAPCWKRQGCRLRQARRPIARSNRHGAARAVKSTAFPAAMRARVQDRSSRQSHGEGLVPSGPRSGPDRIREAFRAHIRAALPSDAHVTFTAHGGSPGFEVSRDSRFLAPALKALSDEWGVPAATVGSGGSIPVAGEVRDALGLDALMIGFAQNDDRIHSPNEQYGLDSFHKGIRSWVRVLAALADAG